MYKQIIERVTREIVLKQTRETMSEFICSKLDSCRLFKPFDMAYLLGIKNNTIKFRIAICSRDCSVERLIAFAHEVLHIFYFVPELPRTKEQYLCISEEIFWFLEDTVENLAIRTVQAQEHFWREMFEKSFGFAVDTTPIDIK